MRMSHVLWLRVVYCASALVVYALPPRFSAGVSPPADPLSLTIGNSPPTAFGRPLYLSSSLSQLHQSPSKPSIFAPSSSSDSLRQGPGVTEREDLPSELDLDHPFSSIQKLPASILSRVVAPQYGLASSDMASIFATSKNFRALKSTLGLNDRFYYAVAEPFLSAKVGDHPLRIAQSLYKCTRLPHSPKGKKAMTLFLRSNEVSEVDIVVACAEHYHALIESGTFPGVQSIPFTFHLQFIYQTMSVRGAFPRLLHLFKSSLSANALLTLQREFICMQLFDILKQDNAVSLAEDLFKNQPDTLPGGCLAMARSAIFTAVRRFTDTQVSTNSALLERKYRASSLKYQRLLFEFLSSDFKPSQLPDLIQQGLLINILLPKARGGYQPLAVRILQKRDLNLVSALLDMGINLNHGIVHDINILDAHMISSETDFDLVRYLLENGIDVNGVDDTGESLLSDILMSYRPDKNILFLKYLIDIGADVMQYDTRGFCPLMRIIRSGNQEMLDYALEKGRPDLNNPSPSGGEPSFLFRLVHLKLMSPALLDTFKLYGLSFSNPNGKEEGLKLIQEATDRGLYSVVEWLKVTLKQVSVAEDNATNPEISAPNTSLEAVEIQEPSRIHKSSSAFFKLHFACLFGPCGEDERPWGANK